VDREERPDLDAIYMKAVIHIAGQGGWPMSVWLTPEGMPFYGGTYFPPTPRWGRPSFRQVLQAVADTWRTREAEVRESAERMAVALVGGEGGNEVAEAGLWTEMGTQGGREAVRHMLRQAAADLVESQDQVNGGWGNAPKFPQALVVDFLLHHYALHRDTAALQAALYALEAMAAGGIFDHLGGGFHRYATDEVWTVPHFEKMLYDNALLARAYLHAYRLTGDTELRLVVEETLDFLLREMRHPAGAFYSTLDADTEGEEGRFYVWEQGEVAQADTPDGLYAEVYGVTEEGNFEGRNILRRAGRLDQIVARPAAARGLSSTHAAEALAGVRDRLRAARAKRVRPHRDDKILSSWNGLTLMALAEAGTALGRPDYLEAARANATFLLQTMRLPDGRLSHSRLEGAPRREGFLEDQAFVMEGLLALYQADLDEKWFVTARDLAEKILEHFAAPCGGFFDTPHDHEPLISRPRELQDNAVPCGGSVAATALLRLAALTGEDRYRRAAEAALATVGDLPLRYPTAFGQWLIALELAAKAGWEVAVVGPSGRADTQDLLSAVRDRFLPHVVLGFREPGRPTQVPLLKGREPQGPDAAATAWVCRGASCSPPVTEPSAVTQALSE